MLLTTPEVLCKEMNLYFVLKKLEKEVLKRKYFWNIHVYENPEYGL